MFLLRIIVILLALWGLFAAVFVAFARDWLRRRENRSVFPASRAAVLLMPARHLTQPARDTLAHFRIQPGDTVLEIGPGPGYFSIRASRMVGLAGRVLCLDVQPEMAAVLNGRLKKAQADSAYPLLGEATRLPLADGCVDKAFLAAVLGEVPDRPAAIAELRRVLKPGGLLGFLETLTDPDYMFRDQLVDLCEAFGFRKLDERRVPLGYSMVFEAP